MSGIEELRQRVQDAEEHFGLAREEQAKYSERLIGLIDTVEDRLREQQAEIDRQQASVAGHDEALAKEQAQIHRLECDNEHLREMLHSLLQAIEAGGRNGAIEVMQTLEQKVGALIAGGATPIEAAAVPEPPELPEPAVEAAPESEPTPEPEMEIAAEPLAESVAEPEVLPEAEPAAETMAEPEMEAAPEPVTEPEAEAVAEVAPETEMEEDPEPVAEPEIAPVAEAASEPEMEMAPEPEMEELPEPAEEIAPEMAAEENAPEAAAEPQENPAAEAEAANVSSTVAALEEIASQLTGPGIENSGDAVDSLHEIMDRVSKLVRETDDTEADNASADVEAAPAETKTSSEQKTAAG